MQNDQKTLFNMEQLKKIYLGDLFKIKYQLIIMFSFQYMYLYIVIIKILNTFKQVFKAIRLLS